MNPIRNVIVTGMGFTQNVGEDVGCIKLWKLMRGYSDKDTTVITPFTWNQPMKDWAAFIHNITRDAEDPCILFAGYSYGCGWLFQQLSKYLEKWSMDVRCAILCDPVYRSRIRLLAWRSIINRGPLAPVIKIRKNVEEVYSFYQRENKPQAHALVAMDATRTKIHDRIRLSKPHEAMDDHPHFHKKVHDVFSEILIDRMVT